MLKHFLPLTASASLAALAIPALAQPAPPAAPATDEAETCKPRGMFGPLPTYKSVEQLPDGHVTFRLCAPDARNAKVISSDFAEGIPMGFPPGTPRGLPMDQDATGLWSVTTAIPVPADTYRYDFEVDGVRVPDPMATTFSHERVGTNSTFETKGPEGDYQTYKKDVAHGAVSKVDYWSSTLNDKRQATVYTPPGYMTDDARYPVLYLVHGAGDSADSWTSVGHANYILDNLIASGAAEKMIIVMPFGHTPPRPNANMLANTDFGDDLIKDLIPFIDANFRTKADQEDRAMAGLSMGGAHTIHFGLTHPELFDYIGIFSIGLGLRDGDLASYEAEHDAALRQAAEDVDLVYYAMGNEDFLYASVEPTREMLSKYGIEHVYNESGGGHTWINWRRYLTDFAPRLFK